jgi:HAMP domain-containing protein
MGQYDFLWLLGIIVFAGLLMFVFSSLNKPSRKLLNLTRKLSDAEVTNEKTNQLIGLLMSIKSMPKKTTYWDSIKTAYKLVEQNGNVDLELKQKLRTLLHGLSIDQFQGNKKIS